MLPPARIVQVPPLQVPVLQISKSDDPDPVTPGSFLQYALVYTNAGDVVAQNVVITETYPASTTYFAALPAPTSGDNVWSMGDLAPGATGTIVVTVSMANELPRCAFAFQGDLLAPVRLPHLQLASQGEKHCFDRSHNSSSHVPQANGPLDAQRCVAASLCKASPARGGDTDVTIK